MITAVCKYVKGCDALNTIPAAKELLTKQETLIGKGEKVLEFLETEDKLIDVAVSTATDKVIAPLYAVIKAEELYFSKQNNQAMVAELHTTRTEIKNASYKTIDESVRTVLKLARENAAGLAIYSVTEEMLTTIEANMQVLTTANTKQEAYNEEKKAKRAELEVLVDQGKELLDEMDMVADIIGLTHPEAYKGYTEIRSKKEYTERLLTITVLNSETGQPEENARVLVLSTTRMVDGKPFVLIDRKTGKTGEVRNSKREFDIYTITAEKLARDVETQPLIVADNTPQRIELRLKKKKGN